MNPASTRRFRRLTGILGAGWALLAIGLSVSALFAPRGTLTLPLNCSYVSGAAVIESMTEEAWGTGVPMAFIWLPKPMFTSALESGGSIPLSTQLSSRSIKASISRVNCRTSVSPRLPSSGKVSPLL